MKRIKIAIHIKNNETGEMRIYQNDDLSLSRDEETGEPNTYIWEDGNFKCDCNRYLFFQRAKDEAEKDEDGPCYHEKYPDGKYSVNLYDEYGELIYKEFTETSKIVRVK